MSRSAYGRSPCFICGRIISNAGFAQYNHNMAHVRKGHYRHRKVRRHGRTRRGESYSYPAHEFDITKKGQGARAHRQRKERKR